MKKIITIFFIIFFVTGCATVPKREAVSFKGTITSIDGIRYIPSNAIIQNYKASHAWDPVARKLVIKKRNKEAVFCIGANVALVDNNLQKMPASVRMHSGKIMIPASFVNLVLKEMFMPSTSYAKRRIPTYKGKYAVRTIVIDPGHGGRDPGAISSSGIREKDINLAIAKKIKAHLQNNGVKVILTRDSDRFISLWKRAHMANEKMADFFISIHANAARSKYVKGIEVYYLSEAVDDMARATAAAENVVLQYENSSFNTKGFETSVGTTLGDMLYKENRAESIELAESISEGMSKALGVKNRGVKRAKFYVLKGARMPSVLIEIGFLSNRSEAKRLKDPYYQKKLAKAVVDGILLYKHRYETTDGFTIGSR